MLKKADIPSSVKIIGDYAFDDCSYLVNIKIPDSVIQIGKYAFRGCSSLKDFLIPSSVESIGYSVFENCKSLSIITNQSLISKLEFYSYAKCSSLTEITIPSSVTSIEKNVFENCTSLTSIIIPDSVSLIGKSAFKNCSLLKEIIIPSLVTRIENNMFDGCKSLTKIEFHSHLLHIGDYCFQNCQSLTEIIIPDTVTFIGHHAFNNCINLEKVVNIPATLKVADFGCFCGDTKLSEVSFEGENILLRQDSFSRCLALSTFSLPNAMNVTIDLHAFHDSNANFTIYVPLWAEINGQGASEVESRIERYAHEEIKNNVATISNSVSAPVINSLVTHAGGDSFQSCDSSNIHNVSALIKRIRFLEDKLSKYEQVSTFDLSNYKTQLINDSADGKNLNQDQDDYEVDRSSVLSSCDLISTNNQQSESEFVIEDNDENSFQILSKSYEDDISVIYKVYDKKRKNVVYKKIFKVKDIDHSEDYLANAAKKFKILHAIDHPCVIRAIAINTNEKISNQDEENNNKNKNDSHHLSKKEHKSKKYQITTALYFEYLEFTLKECILHHDFSNTLKARISVEIGCGMAHLHHRGMIIHDLNLNRIKLNGVFNAKIVSFGIYDLSSIIENDDIEKDADQDEALMFQSPEFVSKKEFDNKIDIYSYGILLYYIFVGNIPKQSLQDKIDGKPIKLTNPSNSISSYCLDVVRKCTSFNPKDRPTMDEILSELRDHSYNLAPEIESEAVLTRHRALNRFESTHRPVYQFS